MQVRKRVGVWGFAWAVLAIAAMALPAGASAAQHLMKIREVFPGSKATPTVQWVELQMHAAGQNQVQGHRVVVYDSFGEITSSAEFLTPVPNAENQRSILIGSPDTPSKDLEIIAPMMSPLGGAVCFEDADPPFTAIDCVSWGNFSTAPPRQFGFARGDGYPGPSEPNVLPLGIPDGNSIERSIAPNCPTLLEGADDTDSSLADFAANATPSPRNNTTAPTETACVSKLKAKSFQKVKRKKVRVKVRFIAAQPGNLVVKAKGRKNSRFKTQKTTVITGDTKRLTLKTSKRKSRKICPRRGKKSRVKVVAKLTPGTNVTETYRKRVKVKCR